MAGAGKGRGKGPAIASGVVLGGFLLLGLVLLGVAATIILSLISIYTNTNSKPTNGDFMRIKAFGLKALHSQGGSSFSNGAVTDSSDSLSTLCTTMYSKSTSASNFLGCKATGFKASNTGVNNSNTSRRRRQAEFGVFMIGEIQIYYSTTCGQSQDIDKGTNATSISDCVKTRLQQCNTLANSSGLTLWTSSTGSVVLSIVATTGSSVSLTANRIYAAGREQTANYASSAFTNATAQSLALLGCTYGGPLSLTAIAAALASNTTSSSTATTSASG